MNRELLSVEQVAAEIGCCQLTIRRKIYSGQLPSLKSGRLVRVRREDLDAFLASAGSAMSTPDKRAKP